MENNSIDNDFRFILYPYGMWGKYIRDFIYEKYGVKPYLIIDNKLSNEDDNIYKVEKLKDVEKGTHIIITCAKGELCNKLEKSIKSVRDDLSVDFIFAKNGLSSELTLFWKRKLLLKKLDETKFYENGMVYNLSNGKSKFFLPFWYTDYVQQNIFYNDDYYEAEDLSKVFCAFDGRVLKATQKGGVILDIGANIGNHAIYFINEINAPKVFCFEPVPETFRILKRNIELNRLDSRITAYCSGISDKEEKFPPPFYRYEDSGRTSLEDEDQDVAWQPIDTNLLLDNELIPCRSIDSYNFTNVTLMKIDVEGMEAKVLYGAKNTINLCKPYILVESWSDKFEETCNFFKNIDYDYIVVNKKNANYLFYPKI